LIERARWAEKYLKYRFTDPTLLEQALTHRSASKFNNERLEFLGDALLNFTIARRLYALRPDDAEGDLSRARASLVNKTVLAGVGREIEIDEQIILGPGESRSGGAQRSSALADTLEAIFGAVLLDGGHQAATELIEFLFAERLESLPDAGALKDSKTRLQEWLQGRGFGLPRYAVELIHGRDHNQVFTVTCHVEEMGRQTAGTGTSRRRAEQDAAAAMLAVLSREPD
jgi:ribonuclease III